jgi:hypothetical protein
MLLLHTPGAVAAPVLACNSGSAPQMRDGGRADWYTMNGYLTCNVDPRSAGVTSITRELGYYSSTLGYYVSMGAESASVQQTQAWSKSKYLYTRDTYTPRETVTLRGSFSYYAVPGCGRVDSATVRCVWNGPQYNIYDIARGCGYTTMAIIPYDYPQEDFRVCYYETRNDNGNTNTAASIVPWGPRSTCTEQVDLQLYRDSGGSTVGSQYFGCQDTTPFYLTISGRFGYAYFNYRDGGGSSTGRYVYRGDMTGTESAPSRF